MSALGVELIIVVAPTTNFETEFDALGLDLTRAMIVAFAGIATMDLLTSPGAVHSPGVMFVRSRYDEVSTAVQHDWEQWSAQWSDERWGDYCSYAYFVTRTPIELWRRSLLFLRESVQVDAVYIYGSVPTQIEMIRTRSDLLTWSRVALIREAFPFACHVIPSPPKKSLTLRWRHRLTFDRTLDRCAFFLRRVPGALSAMKGALARKARHLGATEPKAGARFIVLGQKEKTTFLLRFLERRGASFLNTNLDEIVGRTGVQEVALRAPLQGWSPGMAVDDAFETFMETFVSDLREDGHALIRFIEEPWQVLLTDHECDPRGRLLTDAALRAGKTVVFIPEGAQSLADPKVRSTFASVFFDVPGVTRFAVDDAEAANLTDSFPSRSVVVTGYLGSTHLEMGPANRAIDAIVALGLRILRRGRPLAVVNLDHSVDLGLGRAGQPDLCSELLSLNDMIEALHDLGWSICITSRSPAFFARLRHRYRHLPVWFFSSVRWQLLANHADVLIQRDSSLGPQNLANGGRVLVWNDCRLPLASSDWIEANPVDVAVATNFGELQVGLNRLLQGEVVGAASTRVGESWNTGKVLEEWFDSLAPW